MKKPKYLPDKVIFKIKSAEENKIKNQGFIKTVANKHKLTKLKSLSPNLKKESLKKIKVATIPENTDPFEFAETLQSDPLIEWAEPVYYRPVQIVPNDPLKHELYTFNLYEAWDVTTGSSDITVAIIDTGVDYTHEDLQDNIWINPDEIEDDGIDNDENGYIDDIRGWDFIDLPASFVYTGEDPGPPDNDPMDFEGHGTKVAGVVGAKGNNGIGTVGICWDVSLMVLRAGYKYKDGNGYINTLNAAEAMIYAADNGADIINLSYASFSYSNTEREALDYCTEKGILVFAGAGNDEVRIPYYPAAYDNVVGVAGSGYYQGNWYFDSSSNYGLWVNLLAPYSYTTTLIGGEYEEVYGTSMSSAIAAGLAALIKSAHPDWTAEQIKIQLSSTAMAVNNLNPVFDNFVGAGTVDAEAAVGNFNTTPKLRTVNLYPIEISGVQDGLLCPNEEVQLLPSLRNFSFYLEDVNLYLTSDDPYISIIDANCFISKIDSLQIKTSINDPFIIQISPDTPSCHMASVEVSAETPTSGVISTETLIFFLNPLFRNTQPISIARPYTLQLLKLLNDEFAIVYDTYGIGYQNDVHAQLGSLTGGLDEPVQISNPSQTNSAHIQRAVVDGGRIHLIFSGNVGPADNELFYSTMEPVTKQWTEPVRITTDAELSLYPDFQLHNIAVDSNGYPHVVWLDYRGENPQIYYIHKDANGWSDEEVIYEPYEDIQYNQELVLFFDSNDDIYLFLAHLEEKAIYMLKCTNGIWSSPEFVISGYATALYNAKKDSNDCIHLVYNGPGYCELSYIKYNGTGWSAPELIMTDTGFMNQPRISLTPNGNIHVLKETRYPTGYYRQFSEVVFDGDSWSEQKMVLFDPEGYSCKCYDFQVFEDGTHLFTHIAYQEDFLFIHNSIEDANISSNLPVVTDDGLTTTENKTINISWSSTHPSGISDNEYSIGAVPGGYDVRNWKSSGLSTSITPNLTSTPLAAERQCFISVRATNGIDYRSPVGSSDGIIYFPADFEGDGIINYLDLAKFALKWLETDCDTCDGFDLTDDGNITTEDLHIICEKWLKSIN